MIETRARVVSVGNGQARVEASSQQGCAACQSQSSCSVSGLGKFFGRNKPPVAVACDLAVQPGDSLVLSLAESDLLRAGILAYLLPTVLSVLGAITASLFGLGDAAAVAATLAGFAAGLAIARAFFRTPRIQISRTALSAASDSAVPDSFPPLQGDPHD